MSDKGWLVVNIGCIECHVSSALVGVFTTEEEAQSVAAHCSEAHVWREGGQNRYEVWPVPESFGYVDARYAQTRDAANWDVDA